MHDEKVKLIPHKRLCHRCGTSSTPAFPCPQSVTTEKTPPERESALLRARLERVRGTETRKFICDGVIART